MIKSTPSNTFTREDRDLFVELRTQMAMVLEEIKNIKDITTVRIANLEKEKADRKDVDYLQNKINNDIEKRVIDLEKMKEECKSDLSNMKELIETNKESGIKYYTLIIGIGVFFLVGIFAMLIYHLTGIRF